MARRSRRGRRSSEKRFARVPSVKVPRSVLDRSCSHKTTFDSGLLIPIFVDEALPGDTFTVRMEAFARLAPTALKVPIMDNLHLETFFFAIPNRLLWDNWERFMGAQDNPTDSIDYLVPQVNAAAGFGPLSMGDYFGLPTGVLNLSPSALWFRAYNLVYNEWFRDENLQDSVSVLKDDGPDPPGTYTLKRRGKRHDYFTSALPWPQKGLPVGAAATTTGTRMLMTDISSYPSGAKGVLVDPAPVASVNNLQLEGALVGSPQYAVWADATASDPTPSGLEVLVNNMRQAFQIQKLLERDARSGTRYTEIIRGHFGVTSPDMRLQRPEYLGGGYSPLVVSPIAQTQRTDAGESPQGNLAAIGSLSFSGHGFHKSFTEHCTLLGLACVRADLTYQNGLDRMWSRRTRYDYFWPELAHIGEQAILKKEIEFMDDGSDDDIWGYQERYAEYRYKPSKVTGAFRSNYNGSLDFWHLAQDFGGVAPLLNSDFIEENPPVDRVIAVSGEPQVLFDSFTRIKTVRPMPVFGVPGFVDHF